MSNAYTKEEKLSYFGRLIKEQQIKINRMKQDIELAQFKIEGWEIAINRISGQTQDWNSDLARELAKIKGQ